MLKPRLRRTLATSAVALSCQQAAAASVELVRTGADLPLVVVAGELRHGDAEVFARVTERLDQAIVAFDSPGGSLYDGITIGRLVRSRGFATAVMAGDGCASSCALAFLGGSVRFLDRSGFVGFHAAWTERNGVKAESGAGNAIAGAYLANLGMSEQAIYYMTVAQPDDIAALTPAIAATLGIAVDFVGQPGGAAGPAPRAAASAAPRPDGAQPSPTTMHEFAEAFVEQHFDAAKKLSPEGWLAQAADAYAPVVDFFGERLSRAAVLERSSKYMRKWPTRANTLTGRPLVACSGGTCVVTGAADFIAQHAARNARASGSVRYRLELAMTADGARITHESNETTAQRISPLVAGGSTLAAKLQRALGRLGCYRGAIDGIWGTGSQKAMTRFNAVNGRPAETEVSTAVALRAASAPFAPRCQT